MGSAGSAADGEAAEAGVEPLGEGRADSAFMLGQRIERGSPENGGPGQRSRTHDRDRGQAPGAEPGEPDAPRAVILRPNASQRREIPATRGCRRPQAGDGTEER